MRNTGDATFAGQKYHGIQQLIRYKPALSFVVVVVGTSLHCLCYADDNSNNSNNNNNYDDNVTQTMQACTNDDDDDNSNNNNNYDDSVTQTMQACTNDDDERQCRLVSY